MNYDKGPQLTVSQLKLYLKHISDDVKICIEIGSDSAPAHYLLNYDGQLMIHSDCYMQNATETNIKTVLSFNARKENKMQYYTTIEQSKKLLELGLNPDTADMYYQSMEDNIPNTHPMIIGGDYYKGEDLPCWSVGALLELMPIIDDNSYSLSGTLNKGALCKHPCTSVMFQEESPLEAVYNMICWLLERNYIKKGEVA